jgi:hypothetical protein
VLQITVNALEFHFILVRELRGYFDETWLELQRRSMIEIFCAKRMFYSDCIEFFHYVISSLIVQKDKVA